MQGKLEVTVSIDLDEISKSVQEAKSLDDSEQVFEKLVIVESYKTQIQDLVEAFKKVESDVKQIINDKAKSLYGPNWTDIKSERYKIKRSLTGSVFHLTGETEEDFVEVKLSVNTKNVNKFIKENSKLPKGVSYNPNRGESLRITVYENS